MGEHGASAGWRERSARVKREARDPRIKDGATSEQIKSARRAETDLDAGPGPDGERACAQQTGTEGHDHGGDRGEPSS